MKEAVRNEENKKEENLRTKNLETYLCRINLIKGINTWPIPL